MSSPYIGEIRMFAGNFAPAGWMFCDGKPLPIDANAALFNLIGTTYGGDGQSTFNLPDLRGRVPLHYGTGQSPYGPGQMGGVEQVTLQTSQTPAHTHLLMATTTVATQSNPGGNLLANSQVASPYIQEDPTGSMAPQMLGPIGGSQPHENRQPYLGINFIISLYGTYPSQ